MKTLRDIARQRLVNQRLTTTAYRTPADVVRAQGAVQAQDYAGAKWAIGQRTRGAVDATVERAMTDGTILRTHVLRPTWHFVTPADIRWMLALTAPRVTAAMAYYNRTLELDQAVFRKSNATITRALRGGKRLTRAELAKALLDAGVNAKPGQRLGHLMMQAELDAVVCSGPLRGKQFTYALLEERVPTAPTMDRDEALLELTRRYFTTRGPATPNDFGWWSGLTVADAKRGIATAGRELESVVIDDVTYWAVPGARAARLASPVAHLLPNYDEYFIGHKDRSAIGERVKASRQKVASDTFFAHVVAIDGQLVGGWKRIQAKGSVVVELKLAMRLTGAELRAVAEAARRYGEYLEQPVQLRGP